MKLAIVGCVFLSLLVSVYKPTSKVVKPPTKPTVKVTVNATTKKVIVKTATCKRCKYPISRDNVVLASRHSDDRLGRMSPGDLRALKTLVHYESGGYKLAKNPRSTAYGYGQLLRSTYRSVGVPYRTLCPACQMLAMRIYISNRYGTPARALRFWKRHHWY